MSLIGINQHSVSDNDIKQIVQNIKSAEEKFQSQKVQFENIKQYLFANKSNNSPTLVNSNNKTQGEVALTK